MKAIKNVVECYVFADKKAMALRFEGTEVTSNIRKLIRGFKDGESRLVQITVETIDKKGKSND